MIFIRTAWESNGKTHERVMRGAAMYAVAGQAFAAACNSVGTKAFALKATVNYFKATEAGKKLIAEAIPVNVARKVALWLIKIKSDNGNLLPLVMGWPIINKFLTEAIIWK